MIPKTFEEWLTDAPYTMARKEELRLAHASIVGEYPEDYLSHRIASFIKNESYQEYKEARWINSRSDQFKAWSGRYFSAIEAELYKYKSFIKHTPVPERPQLVKSLRIAGSYYYENDYKAFESHFTPEVMKAVECQLYSHCLSATPAVANFINKTLTGLNKLVSSCGLRAKVQGRRMSGDMCTSLGNGFTNLMLYKFILHKKHAYGKALVEGDDGLFACSVPLTAQDFSDIGWTVEIKALLDPCEGHFCGLTFCGNGDIIKDPRRVMCSFGWTSSNIHAGHHIMDSLLRSKALSLAYELPQCPIVGVLARVALQLTEGVDLTHKVDLWGRDWEKITNTPVQDFAPSTQTRDLMARLFNIPILVQLEAERAIRDHDFDRLSKLVPPPPDVQHYAARYIETT